MHMFFYLGFSLLITASSTAVLRSGYSYKIQSIPTRVISCNVFVIRPALLNHNRFLLNILIVYVSLGWSISRLQKSIMSSPSNYCSIFTRRDTADIHGILTNSIYEEIHNSNMSTLPTWGVQPSGSIDYVEHQQSNFIARLVRLENICLLLNRHAD